MVDSRNKVYVQTGLHTNGNVGVLSSAYTVFKEEWAEMSGSRCTKLTDTYSRIFLLRL